MTGAQLWCAHLVRLAILVALAGVLARRLYRHSWAFAIYLSAVLAGNTLTSLWPERFWTPAFWTLKQGVYDVLKLAIAVEVAARTVAAFPGAAAGARRLALVLVPAALLAVLTGPPNETYAGRYQWQGQLIAASAWGFSFTAMLVAVYHLPIHRWHRTLLLTFTPYLLVFGFLVSLLRDLDPSLWSATSMADSVSYLLVSCCWALAAWRPQGVEIALDVSHRATAPIRP